MTDRYAVIGNPVAHSKSPQIHAAFARQTGQDIVYERLLAPLDGFRKTVEQFFLEGGKGLNVTVPFKGEACEMMHLSSGDAEYAQAVNTIKLVDGKLNGHNTDGIGLVADLQVNCRFPVRNKRVLLMGAGGATRGVLRPLLQEHAHSLIVANRTLDKAQKLIERLSTFRFRATQSFSASSYAGLANQQFDLVINATSAGLSNDMPPLPEGIFAPDALAYDMVYGRETPFMAFARRQGARAVDGLGMLVEQAAESFYIWRGVRPQTAPVIAQLRAES